ncbi:hypothetical protein EI42_05627 [Thermosporothrix hazakensis]|uniref:Uncharacterized protein n=1 Tax=Thermosporothrix hazakensis TaxID=644383 RepID=A0A326TVJ8_THEHA|nr:hypothetical protein EI42_05627 [Thermosporothrix hazakensis]
MISNLITFVLRLLLQGLHTSEHVRSIDHRTDIFHNHGKHRLL